MTASKQEQRHWAFSGPVIGLALAGVLVVVTLLVFLFWRGEAAPELPWNVVLITLDTTRADRLGCYGARHETPTIDALARQGVRFELCFCPVPLTLPSHSSLMTGLASPRHGVHDNGPERLPAEAVTLAEIFKRQGYATAAVVGAFVLDRRFGLDQGFDHYDDQMPDKPAVSKFGYTERNGGEVTDAALSWLAEKRDAPVFLWVHYFDPHTQYNPPGYKATFSALEPYDAEIAYVDSQLKRLLDGLKRHMGDRTLVVLAADHGEALGQHGELTHGLFTYNPTLRVPLVIRFPDARHAGGVIHAPASLIDVMPSVLHWLQLAVPAELDGVPLALEDTAESKDEPPRPLYFENTFPKNMYGWSTVEGIVLGQQKLIRAPRSELYDLAQDPDERNNLFETDPQLASRLTAKLDEVKAEFASRPALAGPEAPVNDDDLRRLRSLGYVGAAKPPAIAAKPPSEILPDPKDMVGVYNQLQDVAILLNLGQRAQATEILLNVLEAGDPTNKRALWLAAAWSLGEWTLRDRVIACLRQRALAKERPCTHPFVLGALGTTLLADGRPSDAAKVFVRLAQIDPSAAACRYLASAYDQLGMQMEAEKWREREFKLARPNEQPKDWEPQEVEWPRLPDDH